MNFNYTKCKHLPFGNNSPPRHYTMGSSAALHQICTVDEENDLGIMFSHNFKFRSHIQKMVATESKQSSRGHYRTFKYLHGPKYYASVVYKSDSSPFRLYQ